MSLFAGVLVFFLVVNCLVLILLVLMQLPKKDAGAGLAFGGGAADALFGAGSGNFLTQATKYGVIVFCVLALLLGRIEVSIHSGDKASAFVKGVQEKQMQGTPVAPPPTAPTIAPPAAASSNMLLSAPSPTSSTTSAPAK